MTDTNQKQLGNTLWSIAGPLRGVKDTQFELFCGYDETDRIHEKLAALR